MIIDAYNQFADDFTAVGSGSATTILGDVMDLKDVRDIGNGQPVYLIIVITDGIEPDSTGNITLSFVSADTATISSSPTTHWTTGALAAAANFPTGKTFVVPLPAEGPEWKQFIGVLITRSATMAAGAVTAFLSLDPTGWKAYPEADV